MTPGHNHGVPNGDSAANTEYSIPQHLTWMDPKNRKLRVLTIGAGISGILMAYRLQKDCENVEHVIYERNSDIGGLLPTQFVSFVG
jgi:ribulose 1,5-bisphosphate synthetase/thiazole synthase